MGNSHAKRFEFTMKWKIGTNNVDGIKTQQSQTECDSSTHRERAGDLTKTATIEATIINKYVCFVFIFVFGTPNRGAFRVDSFSFIHNGNCTWHTFGWMKWTKPRQLSHCLLQIRQRSQLNLCVRESLLYYIGTETMCRNWRWITSAKEKKKRKFNWILAMLVEVSGDEVMVKPETKHAKQLTSKHWTANNRPTIASGKEQATKSHMQKASDARWTFQTSNWNVRDGGWCW